MENKIKNRSRKKFSLFPISIACNKLKLKSFLPAHPFSSWLTGKSILTLEQIEEQKAVHCFHFDDTTQIDCCKLDHSTVNENIEFLLTPCEVYMYIL